jgi:peptidoglycan hydrolase-like protein with peptidoglycan-binding domain
VSYILFPGVKATPIEDAAEARSLGEAAANQFVAAGGPCDNVGIDFTAYPQLQSGSTGDAVKAAQCLLTAAGNAASPSGTFDTATVNATTAFQTARSLPANGIVDYHTWTALLSRGDKPTLRNGSTGAAVRRLQRSLTAALRRTVGIDGQFGAQTEQAVRDYQSTRSLGVDGIVGTQTWTALQAGK